MGGERKAAGAAARKRARRWHGMAYAAAFFHQSRAMSSFCSTPTPGRACGKRNKRERGGGGGGGRQENATSMAVHGKCAARPPTKRTLVVGASDVELRRANDLRRVVQLFRRLVDGPFGLKLAGVVAGHLDHHFEALLLWKSRAATVPRR